MPRELARTEECVAVASPEGRLFIDHYDPDRLAEHLNTLAPADFEVIDEYVGAIRVASNCNFFGEAMFARRMETLTLAVLGQLEATANWHRIGREWVYGDPPATPLGEAEARFFSPAAELA